MAGCPGMEGQVKEASEAHCMEGCTMLKGVLCYLMYEATIFWLGPLMLKCSHAHDQC
jgi:hypothetical protein